MTFRGIQVSAWHLSHAHKHSRYVYVHITHVILNIERTKGGIEFMYIHQKGGLSHYVVIPKTPDKRHLHLLCCAPATT
jgi:hypothetical protein